MQIRRTLTKFDSNSMIIIKLNVFEKLFFEKWRSFVFNTVQHCTTCTTLITKHLFIAWLRVIDCKWLAIRFITYGSLLDKSLCIFPYSVNSTRSELFGISLIKNEAKLLFFEYMDYHKLMSSGHGSVPQNNKQLFKFLCRPRSRVDKVWKCWISTMFLISNKTSIFACRDVKYYTHSCRCHGTVIINIGQIYKFLVSKSAPITHFSKHSEDLPGPNGHSRTDIAEFGPILPNLVRCQ